jgi:hypothetical protein
MSVAGATPADFTAWCRRRDPAVGAASFAPRAWYGAYLAERLGSAAAAHPGRLEIHSGRIGGLLLARGRRPIVVDATGRRRSVDRAVLAVGHAPPVNPGVGDRAARQPALRRRSVGTAAGAGSRSHRWPGAAGRHRADRDRRRPVGGRRRTGRGIPPWTAAAAARGDGARAASCARDRLVPRHRSADPVRAGGGRGRVGLAGRRRRPAPGGRRDLAAAVAGVPGPVPASRRPVLGGAPAPDGAAHRGRTGPASTCSGPPAAAGCGRRRPHPRSVPMPSGWSPDDSPRSWTPNYRRESRSSFGFLVTRRAGRPKRAGCTHVP